MKRALILLFTFFYLLINFGCGNQTESKAKDEKPSDSLSDDELTSIEYNYGKTDSLLWEISGNGLSKSSYLFGTVHIIPKEQFFISKDMLKTFRKSEQLVLEMDMGELNPLDLAGSEKMSLPEGITLKSLLTADEYKYLETYFDDTLGMKLSLINKTNLKPIFLSTLITQVGSLGGTESYEMTLTAWAKMQKKEIKGLETMDFQFSVFDSIPYQKQAEMLMEAVKNNKTAKKELEDLYKYYIANELSKLVSLSHDSESELMEFEDVLLIKRNEKWIPLIEQYAKEKPCFFAVGALHLPGKNGVIKLLRDKGYKVVPVNS
ncbi:MAG: TraB/GumN family protein [Bacteroidales bacterium]|nr:TraB/GumN family protein [Bacteroidales bacterium]